jgi:hypothetical protein
MMPAKQLPRNNCRERAEKYFFILLLEMTSFMTPANYAAKRLPRRDYTIVWVIGLNRDCREVSDYSFVINDFIYDAAYYAANRLPRRNYTIVWVIGLNPDCREVKD